MFVALPQLPQRVYQPKLVDPGLHGGVPAAQNYSEDGQTFKGLRHNPGDVTVDGRVAVLYRLAYDSTNSLYRPALQVCVFDPDFLQETGGYLDAFQHQLLGPTIKGTNAPGFATNTVPSAQQEEMWGTAQSFTDLNGAYTLHFEPETDSTTQDCVGGPNGPCPSIDPNVLPNFGRIRPLTVAAKQLDAMDPGSGANPFSSDAMGAYQENSGYLTYKLWMVMPHYPVPAAGIACDNANLDIGWYCDDGIWKAYNSDPQTFSPMPSILGARDLEVTINLNTTPHSIERAVLGDFQPLETMGATGPEQIVGVEPSITADGKLLLYHGDSGNNEDTKSEIDYVYNPDSCELTGWTYPKSITAIYGETAETDFSDRYALARQPIREPVDTNQTSGFTSDYTYLATDEFNGAYPWVSRDGSFFLATHTHAFEGLEGQKATRTSLIACGEITGGYVKHIDDRALNPTRSGRLIDWPQVGVTSAQEPIYDDNTDAQMTTFFSTGLKPGLWRPFPGEEVAVPTSDADARIPVLPVWVNRTRMYGEARFEEADGNYVLYLACNEAFRRNPGGPSQAEPFDFPAFVDENRTSDTSGRPNRPSCYLDGAAGFGREAHVVAPPGPNGLESDLADKIFARTGESHENIGFKGQGILFNTSGAVLVEHLPTHGSEVTFQAFVKPMRDWNTQPLRLITDDKYLELELLANGKFRASVHASSTTGQMAQYAWRRVTSDYQLDHQNTAMDELDPSEGWIHVAAVYNGDDNGSTTLKLYLDGKVDKSRTWSGTGKITKALSSPGGSPRDIYIGPRLSGGGDITTAVLVLDEVAISDVARTEGELRRDAFVGPLDSEFEPIWHPEPDYPRPTSLSLSEVKWPVGLEYTELRTQIGELLFADDVLSVDTSSVSCLTCHEPGVGFAEFQQTAFGVGPSDFNTPTILNTAFGTHKTFDGRADSIVDQVLLPLESGNEMGEQTVDQVIQRMLNGGGEIVPGVSYELAFSFAFGGGTITEDRLAAVLALASLTRLSGISDFDGGDAAMSAMAEEGRALFFGKARCSGCHSGSAFSDDDFHNILTVDALGDFDGRGGFTGRDAEIGKVKTPTLRDVALTKPYFHDGSKDDLIDVVQHYNGGFQNSNAKGHVDRFLVPIDLDGGEEAALVAFLQSLTTN